MELSIFKNKGVNSVNTRDLHKELGVRTPYSKWIKRLISDYGFIEGKDYSIKVYKNFLLKSEQEDKGSNIKADKFDHLYMEPLKGQEVNRIDYIAPISVAKEIGMLSKTPKGREIRRYFIGIEEQYQLLSKSKQKKLKAKLAKSKAKLAELEVETYILQGESNEAGWYLRKQARDMFMRVSEQMTVQESVEMSRRIRRLVNLPKEKGWNRATVDQTNKRYKLLKEYL